MKEIHKIDYRAKDIHEQIDMITNNKKANVTIELTIRFIAEQLVVKSYKTIDILLITNENSLELCFLYKTKCYNPMNNNDMNSGNPLKLFFEKYYDDISFSYCDNTNKLLFTYSLKNI